MGLLGGVLVWQDAAGLWPAAGKGTNRLGCVCVSAVPCAVPCCAVLQLSQPPAVGLRLLRLHLHAPDLSAPVRLPSRLPPGAMHGSARAWQAGALESGYAAHGLMPHVHAAGHR